MKNYTGREGQRKEGNGDRRGRKKKDTSDTLLYADDLGARESAETLGELEEKTEIMIRKLYKVMRDNRLAVNSNKTQIMCLRSTRKRKVMGKKEKGEMQMKVEGMSW